MPCRSTRSRHGVEAQAFNRSQHEALFHRPDILKEAFPSAASPASISRGSREPGRYEFLLAIRVGAVAGAIFQHYLAQMIAANRLVVDGKSQGARQGNVASFLVGHRQTPGDRIRALGNRVLCRKS